MVRVEPGVRARVEWCVDRSVDRRVAPRARVDQRVERSIARAARVAAGQVERGK